MFSYDSNFEPARRALMLLLLDRGAVRTIVYGGSLQLRKVVTALAKLPGKNGRKVFNANSLI